MKKIILSLVLILSYNLGFSQGPTLANQVAIKNAVQGFTGSVVSSTNTSVTSGTLNAGGFTQKSTNTLTTSNGVAYTSGDNFAGINTLTVACRQNNGTGVIQDVSLWDKDKQASNFTIDYWDTSPSGTYTDNAAEVIAGDHGVWLGKVSVYASDWVTQGAIGRCTITSVGIGFQCTGATKVIYFTIATTSTPTQTSTSAMISKHTLLQD